MERWLSPKDVCDRTTLSRAQIERMAEAGDFPKPLSISARRVVWIEEEVEEWMVSRIKASRQGSE